MQDLTKGINSHLACEFQASHTYLAMSIWLREKDLAGFSVYMQSKSQEERGHADRLIAYLVDSDAEVELPAVLAPKRNWESIKQSLTRFMKWSKVSPPPSTGSML